MRSGKTHQTGQKIDTQIEIRQNQRINENPDENLSKRLRSKRRHSKNWGLVRPPQYSPQPLSLFPFEYFYFQIANQIYKDQMEMERCVSE